MPLLNYTTSIEVDKTIGEIQKCLVAHGAKAILCDYDDQGYIQALAFKITLEGQDIGFRLPTDWHPVLDIMKKDPKVPNRLCVQEQALRVAWRITKDWVEAQMAIVETKMVEMPQVFLPYAVNKNGQTFYEKSKPLLIGGGN